LHLDDDARLTRAVSAFMLVGVEFLVVSTITHAEGEPLVKRTLFAALVLAIGMSLLAAARLAAGETPTVNESARRIPVAYSVDVVVVGGGTGAVSAAVAAARAGAGVFLAAPRPYLGDDMTATLRLWLEEGEVPTAPLAKALFHDPLASVDRPSRHRISFTYAADRPSAALHPDTAKPSRLSDLAWGDPTRQSVQYDDDVNLTLDLGEPRDVAGVHVWTYQRTGSSGFRVRDVTVFTSDDKRAWREGGTVDGATSKNLGDASFNLPVRLSTRTRYLKLHVRKAPGAARILLGEIEVVGPVPEGEEETPPKPPWPRPMHVKQTLDRALLDAGVDFLYNCYATGVLSDADGRPSGIVMANRAGRQAVVAKVVIDATDRAAVARMAGAHFRPYPPGPQTFRRVVIGGAVQKAPGMTSRVIEPPFVGAIRTSESTGVYPIIEYTLTLPMTGDTEPSWANADQQARTRTYHPGQQFTSDVLFQVPPDCVVGRENTQDAPSPVDEISLGVFRPKDVARLFVLGGCADVSRPRAEKLLRPLALIDLGTRLGSAVAAEAKLLPEPTGVKLRGRPASQPVASGDVREILDGVRPNQESNTIGQDARALPVVGRYDVVVIGGGTAGAPAGIAAARQGAQTLVVEKLSALGGVGTTGAISIYCQGNRVGFTSTVAGGTSWIIEEKTEWWRSTLLEAGADVWFGAIGCGVLVDDREQNRVFGAVIATPRGRAVVLARVVVDATGNADLAAAAGVPCVYTDESEFAMQGTGLPPRQLGATYTNTDYTYTDETDLVDVWHLLVYAKDKYRGAFDLGQLVDTRERRRIRGDYTLTILDQVSERTFGDSIAKALTSYDTHGYIVDPYLLLRHPLRQRFTSYIPYRCLLPRGFEGLIVTGIGLSAHRDAQPIVRMQPDVQNQGYAAGAAAAMAARDDTGIRGIDVRALQRHLVEIGNLPESVLTDTDSHPLPPERVAAAVEHLVDDYRNLAIILGHRQASLPLLKDAYRAANGEKELAYAKVLGMMGDAAGLETLLAEVQRAEAWDTPPAWNIGGDYPEAARVGWGMSHLDNTLVSLGRTRRPEALPAVLAKLAMLEAKTSFSHHRAVYLALEWLGDARAAPPLAELLHAPGMGGHAVTSIDQRASSAPTRSQATRELILARTLYRCGDWEGTAEKTLDTYTRDLRGHFARHARAVLAAGKEYKPPY